MHIGMLWFDNTPGLALRQRLEKAADYYRKKYRQEPNLCLVNPTMLQTREDALLTQVGDIHVRCYEPVLPGHLWLGIEDRS